MCVFFQLSTFWDHCFACSGFWMKWAQRNHDSLTVLLGQLGKCGVLTDFRTVRYTAASLCGSKLFWRGFQVIVHIVWSTWLSDVYNIHKSIEDMIWELTQSQLALWWKSTMGWAGSQPQWESTERVCSQQPSIHLAAAQPDLHFTFS